MTKFHKLFSFTLLFACTFWSLTAQNLTVTKHDLSDFHPDANSTYFAEGENGEIWVLQWGGFDADRVVKYDGSTWTEVAFDGCSNCTRRIVNDADGSIYLGTTSGIYSWGGGNWTLETDRSVADSDMAIDSQGTLWFKTGSGDNNLASLTTDGTLTEHTDISGGIFEITIAPDDKVWMRIANEVVVFDGNQTTSYSDFFTPLYLDIDADGVVWVTNTFGEIGIIENGTANTDVLSGVTIGGIGHTSFAIDRASDYFWFGQQGTAGLVLLAGGNTIFVPNLDLFVESFNLVNRIFVTSTGAAWVGSNFISDVAEVKTDISSIFESVYEETNLFPNPATTAVNLEIELALQATTLAIIFDQSGRIASSTEIMPSGNTLTIDISSLEAGQYFISLPNEQRYARFVKQ